MAALVGVNVTPKSSGDGGDGDSGGDPGDSGGYTTNIPLDLLSEDGVPPEQGDSVSFSVEGTVQSVDAEDATVKITSVNGQPVDESAAEETTEDQGAGAGGGPPQPGGQAGGAAGAGGRGGPIGKPSFGVGGPLSKPISGPLSPGTLALGAALKKKARGQPMPF